VVLALAVPSLTLALVAGAALACAPVLIWAGRRPAPVRLSDGLAQLAGRRPTADPEVVLPPGAGRLDRFGAWLATRRIGAVSERTRRVLSLQGRSVGDLLVEKTVWALGGLMLPLIVQLTAQLAGMTFPVTPVLLGLALGVSGWFLPDLRLRSAQKEVQQDAAEAVLTFVDLVTLSRLANQSASRAVLEASQVSDHPVMLRIRATLERARLEQQAPWSALERLSRELDLPGLGELVEVLTLDEQGASLVATLRARAAEMRDAHLTSEKLAAHQVSESMTVWMVVPVLVLALILLTPPLMSLSGVSP
jgi:hypothetical protein